MLWAATHHATQFPLAIIPALVPMALWLGLQRGTLRVVQAVSASDGTSAPIHALSDRFAKAWSADGSLPMATLLIAAMRPAPAAMKNGARWLFGALSGGDLCARGLPWPPSGDGAVRREVVIDR